MKELKAVHLNDEDFTAAGYPGSWMERLTKDALTTALAADVVLHKGRVIKNRFGSINEVPNAELNGTRRASDFSAELGAGG